ncbi:hypothetical protein SAMN03159448_06548 [Sinorhizobium sp. NFACC03]|nr:hypothetical protein SAMN03159448_06548 [Sinorhizobium sp. NFACC03]
MKVMAVAGERNELRSGDRVPHLGLMFLGRDHVLLAPENKGPRGNILEKRRRVVGKLLVTDRMPYA